MEHINAILPTVLNQNKELAQPLTKPIVSTDDEKSLSLAVKGVKVKHFSEEELKQVMRSVFHIVGLRAQNYPEGDSKTFLHAYITENYGGHTGAEIRLAFTMAIQNKLEIEPSEVLCYENFSVAYFTRIMNAFRAWSDEAIKHIETIKPVQKIYSDNLTDNENRKYTEECYQRFLAGNTNYFPTSLMKPILIKDGIIKEDTDVKEYFEKCMRHNYKHIYHAG